MQLTGKTAVITGGASGIGKATVELFVQKGANVVVADHDRPGVETLVSTLFPHDKKMFEVVDVRDASQVQGMVERCIQRFGRIDILFNNAGVEVAKPIHQLIEEEWDRVLDTNLKGAFLCSKFVIPSMIDNGGGVIINNSSQMARLALENAAPYCASKSGLVGLTRAMALDLIKYNIRVNAVLPGSIDTPLMWQDVKPEQFDEIHKECSDAIPMKRVGKPTEVAKFILFLVSDEASYITGTCLGIDGGLGARLATIK
jgi:NAD(P)-dependent dehydrogenase (short-subunit alcohol dehydrogenase family)